MNKKFIALTLCAMLMVSFTGCGDNSNEENSNKASKSSNTSVSASSKQDSESSKNTESNLVFWYNKNNWKEISGTYDGTFVTANLKAPIDISRLDEHGCTPYAWFPNGRKARNAKSINEILTSNEKQLPQGNRTKICTQLSFDKKWISADGEDDGIAEICIYNYNEDVANNNNHIDNSLPISTCYKNNWWYVILKSEAFGVPTKSQNSYYQDDRADALIKVLGAPKYVINDYSSDFQEILNKNEGSTYYRLVYDFGEYVITVSVNELIMNEYNSAHLEIREIKYYPKECWEQELKKIEKSKIINLT